ncbi:MAG: protoporphyrin/coproporphyrin ferrochelatase [Acidobacteriota bacterium]|jgi:ferrochelatase
MIRPFDAVLVIAFGGPQGPADVRPFLANVLRGRRVTPERVEEVAHHYELFGGVSPLTELTMRQASLMRDRLRDEGLALPVYLGMRNWHPYLQDTLTQMSRDGVTRAVGFIAAAQRSYSSCTQYRENVDAARAGLRKAGLRDVSVTYVGDWHTHPGFVEANAAHVTEALATLPADLQRVARIVFTAHSIPVSMAERSLYRRHLEESAAAIAARLGRTDFALVYQSRSGRPEDPWLGPDVGEYLKEEHARGLRAVVLCPVGFLCDHVEVLYDLDIEAANVCRDIALPMARASAVNDHPRFIDTMVDAVMQTVRRYDHARPLQIVAAASL